VARVGRQAEDFLCGCVRAQRNHTFTRRLEYGERIRYDALTPKEGLINSRFRSAIRS